MQMKMNEIENVLYFYAPGLKGPPWASSNRIVRVSVCPFVCLILISSRVQKSAIFKVSVMIH